MSTTKPAGTSCPNCGGHCAEFKHLHETFTRWSCTCGAEGRIAVAPVEPVAPKVHPHWTEKRLDKKA